MIVQSTLKFPSCLVRSSFLNPVNHTVILARVTSHLQLMNTLGMNRPSKVKAVLLCTSVLPFTRVHVKLHIPLLTTGAWVSWSSLHVNIATTEAFFRLTVISFFELVSSRSSRWKEANVSENFKAEIRLLRNSLVFRGTRVSGKEKPEERDRESPFSRLRPIMLRAPVTPRTRFAEGQM